MIADPATFELLEVRVGRPKIIGTDNHRRQVWSSIHRRRVRRRNVYVTWTGISGDQVTDSRPKTDTISFGNTEESQIHGGRHRAIYVFPSEHYPRWLGELGEAGVWRFVRRFRLNRLGIGRRSFGENWRLRGITEDQVHIGDIWQIGHVKVKVSRVRTPCSTLVTYFRDKSMIKRMRDNGLCGWYLEVIQPGPMPTSGTVQVMHVNYQGPTVAELFAQTMNTSNATA